MRFEDTQYWATAYDKLKDDNDRLISALERLKEATHKLLQRKPVICLDEVFAEAENALKLARGE